jgi:hypothetical protein
MKRGKAPASSSSGSPTQHWPPRESWDSCRGDPRARCEEPDGSKGESGGGIRSSSLMTPQEAGRIISRAPKVALKSLSPGPRKGALI